MKFTFKFKNKTLILTSLVAFGLFQGGCAHVKTDTRKEEGVSQKQAVKIPIVIENKELVINGIKIKNTKFDIPVMANSRVEHWVNYFTGKGRPYFSRYLERSEFFIPYIRPLLKQNGMPEDLVYLSMIESGFNNLARSHAKAVGPWQFMATTGKRYGLMVNWWVDERRDIRKSTLAAVEYLKDLYGMYGSWELAAASYNAGEAKIARAIRRYGTTDFWALSKHRFLRPETRDYVPKIMAAAIIAKNPEQFGFPTPNYHARADEAVAGDGELVKLIKTDKPEEQLPADYAESENLEDILEAEDTRDSAGDITPATLTVPTETNSTDNTLVNNDSQPLAKPVPTPHIMKNGEVGGAELTEYEVQSPADLLKVARAAGLSYQTVKALNPELIRWCTPPAVGSYRIKLPVSVKDRFLTTYNHAAFPRKVDFLAYKVRRGDTLAKVARHFGIKVDPISDLNGVSPRLGLRGGVKILLPMPNDRSRSMASLEVRDPPERRRIRRVSHRRPASYKSRVSYKKRHSAQYTIDFKSKSSS